VKGLLPALAVVRRRPAAGAGHLARSAAERNVRVLEQFSRQQSPDPIRYGDTPANPSRQQIVTFLAIAPYKAVMTDDFMFAVFAPSPHAKSLRGPGRELDWQERQNVHRPDAEAYGSTIGPLFPAG